MKKVFNIPIVVLAAVSISVSSFALQASDWPVWGQNPANTRSNAAEMNVPGSPTMILYWSTQPGPGAKGDFGIFGSRCGVIANNVLYGSYTLGNSSFAEGRNLTGASKGLMLPAWPNVPANPGQRILNRWTYFPPSFVQNGSVNGYVAFAVGGFGGNPCAQSAGGIQVVDGQTGALLSKTPIALPNTSQRIGVGGTAVEATKKFYLSGFCPLTVSNLVNTYGFTLPSGPFSSWPQGAAPNQYRQFATGDTLASFSPAVAGGLVVLALGRPTTALCPYPVGGTGEIKVINDSNGLDFCTIGPFVTTFDNTPPALIGSLVYSVNFPSLGPSVFDLSKCGVGGTGSCNLLVGSAGPGVGKGMAIANGLVFISAEGLFKDTIEMWDSTMQNLLDVFTVVDPAAGGPFPVQPYIAEANKFVYGVNGHGLVFAAGYDLLPTPHFTGNDSYSSDTAGTTLFVGGVMAVGGGTVVVSSPSLVRVYKLSPTPPPSATPIALPPCIGLNSDLTAMDTVFDPVTGVLLDSRIEGSNVSPAGNFSLQYVGGTWTCVAAPVAPLGCDPLRVWGVSLLGSGTGFLDANGCGLLSYQLSSGVWGVPTPYPSPTTEPARIAMVRDFSPQLGWTVGCGGFHIFSGGAWSCNGSCSACNQLYIGSGMISMVRGDPSSGWSAFGQFGPLYEISGAGTGPFAWNPTPLESPTPATGPTTYLGAYLNSTCDRWACGLGLGFASGVLSEPVIVRGACAGSTPITQSIPSVPPPFDDPKFVPTLMDITFYEPDPLHLKGVAVGGAIGSLVTQFAPGFVLIYVTLDHGGTWSLITLDLAPLHDATLTQVRFIDANTAYAIGYANAGGGFGTMVPLLIKITL